MLNRALSAGMLSTNEILLCPLYFRLARYRCTNTNGSGQYNLLCACWRVPVITDRPCRLCSTETVVGCEASYPVCERLRAARLREGERAQAYSTIRG